MFSQISTRSGTITVIGRNRAFRPSGSSDLPRYPGFMVMNAPHVGSREISSPSMNMRALSAFTPSHTDLNCRRDRIMKYFSHEVVQCDGI